VHVLCANACFAIFSPVAPMHVTSEVCLQTATSLAQQCILSVLRACPARAPRCGASVLCVLPVQAEGVCSVKWEDGVLENSIYIGQHGIFALVALPDGAAPRTMSSQASEGVRSRSQSREREGGAQMWWDPASRGRQPGYQHAVHEIARARRDASSPGPEGLGQRSQSPELGVSENTAQRPMRNSSAHARIGNAHAQLHTRAASPDPGSPRSQHRVSHHRWAQGTSGKYADTTVGMGIVGLFVEYVTLFGPAANSRDVDEGDEIVSVEGIDVGNDPDRLVHLISAHHDSRPLVRIKVCLSVCVRARAVSLSLSVHS
jgi:hypothetical protein